MRTLHLFAGAGGGLLADLILGHEPIAAVEWDPDCCDVLRERAAEGWFPGLRVHEGDIRTFDGKPWAGKVDCVAGGFPCTDISIAGKGAGIDGEESGLWREMARIVCEVRPRFVFVENSPTLTSRGLGRVLGDLASLGFDAEWDVFSACECGAPHTRERMFILAYATGKRLWRAGMLGQNGYEKSPGRCARTFWEGSAKPGISGVAYGVPKRVHRLKAVGNAQCPQTAALAFEILMGVVNNG